VKPKTATGPSAAQISRKPPRDAMTKHGFPMCSWLFRLSVAKSTHRFLGGQHALVSTYHERSQLTISGADGRPGLVPFAHRVPSQISQCPRPETRNSARPSSFDFRIHSLFYAPWSPRPIQDKFLNPKRNARALVHHQERRNDDAGTPTPPAMREITAKG
jgi:hypothetical protein